MQYDSYERKIAKVASFLKWVFRHRVPILACTALIFAIIAGLLSTRGIVISESDFESSILYGEELDYSAKAFLSKTSYQYSDESGEEWTDKFPIFPGDYLVRAVAKATVGERYSDPKPFTITARETTVSITESEVVYGEDPKVSANLVNGDKMECGGFDYDEETKIAEADKETIAITNSDGIDVTKCYIILTVAREIETTQRPITVAPNDVSKVYDGQPLTADGFTIVSGTLVDGDELLAMIEGSLTNVGTATSTLTCSVENERGKDVSMFYKITTVSGSISVLPRSITLSSESYSAVYDGETHRKEQAGVTEGELALGETVSFGDWASISAASELENTFVGTISNADGIDVSSNYTISYSYGTLAISKRPIAVHTSDLSDTYNGYPFSAESYELSGEYGLVEGHTDEGYDWASRTYVGNSENTFLLSIKDSAGVDVSANYDIQYTYGQITVLKRTLDIVTASPETIYSGAETSFTQYNVRSGSLADTDQLRAIDFTVVKNVGSYTNNVTYEILNRTSGEDMSANYDFSVSSGTITVTQRPLTVTIDEVAQTYDGMDHTFTDLYGDLIFGHVFEIVSATTFNGVGNALENRVEYIIRSEDGDNVTSNYEITNVFGTVTINKRDITVTMGTDAKIYDGLDFSCTDFTAVNVVSGHTFVVLSSTTEVNADVYANVLGEWDVLDAGGVSVKDNYNLTALSGTLTILKRPVTITTGSSEVTYSDTLLENHEWLYLSELQLADGHRWERPTPNGSILNVGTVDNTFDGAIKVFDAYNNDVTFNYEIEAYLGTLTVLPRPITVVNSGIDRVVTIIYDGAEHSFGTISLSDGTLCTNHYFNVTEFKTVKNVTDGAEYVNIVFEILNGDNNNVTANYDITKDWSTVTVLPRPITVFNEGEERYIEFVYDAIERTYSAVGVGGSYGLCTSHEIRITAPITHKNVVTGASLKLDFRILDGDGVNVTSNYDITEEWSTITILPRPITVFNDGEERYIEFVYDAIERTYSAVGVGGSYGLCTSHVIEVITPATHKNVVTNATLSIGFLIMEGDENVTRNYDITYEWSTLTIKPRPITVYNYGEERVIEFVYDGLEHTYNTVGVRGSYGLCSSHYIEVYAYHVHKDVVTNALLDIDFLIMDGYESVTSNYDITYEWSTLTIKHRPITVYNYGVDTHVEFIYDGQTHIYDTVGVRGEYGLCSMHRINVTDPAEFKKTVTDASMAIGFEILDENGANVIANYEITEEWSTITISPRPISILTDSYYGEYDGKEHNVNGIQITEGRLYGSDYFLAGDSIYKNVVYDEINVVSFVILDESGDDVTVCYEITADYGTVTIYPRAISITTESYYAEYDGKEHNLNNLSVTENTLCDGHELVAGDAIYKDVVTNVPNIVSYTIYDEYRNDVTANYEVTLYPGTVTIYKKVVKVYTESYTWEYDGQSHSYPYYKIIGGYELVAGHNMSVQFATEITEVGSVPNVLAFMILDGVEIVSANYNVIIDTLGILTITSEEDTEDTPKIEPPEDEFDIGAPLPYIPYELGDPSTVIVFVINADTTGQIYLKQKSYGDYRGNGFDAAPLYDQLLADYLSAYYLASKAAENGGAELYSMLIDSKFDLYVLPYYSSEYGITPQLGDRYIEGDASNPYTVYYYVSVDGASLPLGAVEFEALYAEFVRENYLQIPDSTKAYFDQVILENGFDITDPDIVLRIAQYIQNAASYNLEYDRELDNCGDIAVEFLRTYKEGICQHYAAAATMLYRALGIPARYTVGYTTETRAGQDVNVYGSDGHAWVEVYVDGIGWVQVEVTGAPESETPPPPPPEPPIDPPTLPETLIITPEKFSKVYDSTPLYAENTIVITSELAELLSYGYTYRVQVSGVQIEVGIGESTVTLFRLFDPDGNDVTSQIEIIYEKGELEVVAGGIIDIYIHEKKLVYDGLNKSYNADEYVVLNAPDGVTLVMNRINISATDVTTLTSNAINNNISRYLEYSIYVNGELDTTGNYTVRVVNYGNAGSYNVLSISKRDITVTTGTSSKTYDGEALTNSTFYVSIGMLGDGHTMTLSVIGTITEVGEVLNTINRDSLVITDENGVVVTQNYTVSYVLGTLKIV